MPSKSVNLWNFESVKKKPKLCSHVLKVVKAKVKVYRVLWNFAKAKSYITEISWNVIVSCNLINYCKTTQFLIKFCKSLKHFRKILLEKLSNIALILLTFIHALKNGWKLPTFVYNFNKSVQYSTKVFLVINAWF